MTVLASTVFSGSPSGTDVGLVQVADLTVSANVLGNTTFGIDASAGAVRVTLPPATGSGDRIVITADDVTNTAEIASGDSLNGEALGSIFPALNDVVYLIDAKAGEWTGRTLPAPTVVPVDEFNSNAVVTSTVGTLSFAAGDIVITDPNNVETWFAGPSADSTLIGGAIGQFAILLDNAYTTLNVAVDAALQGEDIIFWWDNLAVGDTVNGLGLTVSEVIGAGTLTGNGGTADGTGPMGLRVANADGNALILTSAVTATGAIHLFAEVPAPTTPTAQRASARVMAFSGSGQTALGTVTSTTSDANNAENLFDATARVPLTSAGWTGVNFQRPEANNITIDPLEFVIEQDGRYRIDAEIGISGGLNARAVQVVRNGTEILAISTGYSESASDSPRAAEVYENLAAGDTIDVRIAHQSTATPGFNNINILVEQVGQLPVVPLDVVPPVDQRDVLFAKQTGLGFGSNTLLDSGNWEDHLPNYEHIEFNCAIRVTGVTEDVLRTITVKASDFIDNSRWRLEYGAAIVDFEPGPLTGNQMGFSGSTIDTIGVEVVGVRAQQSFLPPGSITPTVPQSGVTYLAGGTAVSLAGPAAMAGLSVSLPEAGTYQLIATLEGVMTGNPTSECVIQALLHDGSAYLRDGTPLSIATMAPNTTVHSFHGSSSIILDYVAAGPTTIEVHTLASDPGNMSLINIQGGSSIAYRRLGDQIITA